MLVSRTIVEVDSVKNIITFGNIIIAKNIQNTICWFFAKLNIVLKCFI